MSKPIPRPDAHLRFQFIEESQQRELLQQLVTNSPSGIVVFDAIRNTDNVIIDFKPILYNQAAINITGDLEENFQQLTHRQRFPEAQNPGLFAQAVTVTEEKLVLQETRFYPAWNKWLDISKSQVNDGFMIVFTDITPLKQSEQSLEDIRQQLQRRNQELLKANERLEQFASVASHDLQEPLRKIQQFGDLLNQQYSPNLDDHGRDLLQRMQGAAGRLLTLIKNLLDFSSLSRQPETFRHQNLNQVVDAVLTALELMVAETGAVVEVGSLGTLVGEATQLGQLFQNLLTNALKFAKPGTPPHVQISRQEVVLADLPPAFEPPSGQTSFYTIRVVDQGIGFKPEQAEQIFGTFQRLHSKGHYPGTGLGLSIAKKVVTNHGGYIMAESQPGQGATFVIYLPTPNPASE
ncbi:sensor histidine kinase [Spirosoma flavum]|uniref:histidine kinase n=1 Tax=Spirosoma flavum TaxID=2048557 RepID=A0ABW6ACQ3_9BACT